MPNRPAEANDAPWVPNGRFRNRMHGSLLIHTVRDGQLMGKRIVKRPPTMYSATMKGFAFVMADGSLKLWSRFLVDEGREYVNNARRLLETWQPDDLNQPQTEVSAYFGGVITCEYRCRVCNGALHLGSALVRGMPTAHRACSDINALVVPVTAPEPVPAPVLRVHPVTLELDELGHGEIR